MDRFCLRDFQVVSKFAFGSFDLDGDDAYAHNSSCGALFQPCMLDTVEFLSNVPMRRESRFRGILRPSILT